MRGRGFRRELTCDGFQHRGEAGLPCLEQHPYLHPVNLGLEVIHGLTPTERRIVRLAAARLGAF